MRLKDKVAIITGGSRGIGYATADKFLKEGATVILTASSQGSADKAVAQLKEKYPDATVAGISPNLSNLESVRNAFREAASKYGCMDILVNNAGVSESTPFTEYTEETFDKVMDLNVKGVFNATRAASECMIAKGQGVILSTSSMVKQSSQIRTRLKRRSFGDFRLVVVCRRQPCALRRTENPSKFHPFQVAEL